MHGRQKIAHVFPHFFQQPCTQEWTFCFFQYLCGTKNSSMDSWWYQHKTATSVSGEKWWSSWKNRWCLITGLRYIHNAQTFYCPATSSWSERNEYLLCSTSWSLSLLIHLVMLEWVFCHPWLSCAGRFSHQSQSRNFNKLDLFFHWANNVWNWPVTSFLCSEFLLLWLSTEIVWIFLPTLSSLLHHIGLGQYRLDWRTWN